MDRIPLSVVWYLASPGPLGYDGSGSDYLWNWFGLSATVSEIMENGQSNEKESLEFLSESGSKLFFGAPIGSQENKSELW